MNFSVWLGIGVVASALITTGALGDDSNKPRTIKGWGVVSNPAGDCTVEKDHDTLKMTVPGGVHDLFPHQQREKRFSAPRVMREVDGDFTIQVKVTSSLTPASPAPGARTYPFFGAGLLVWDNEDRYLRLERNVWNANGSMYSYARPLLYQSGKEVNEVHSAPGTFFSGDATWLRVERQGDTFRTAVSPDGKKWTETSVIHAALPPRLMVGVEAINSTRATFTPRFEKFKISTETRRNTSF